MIDRETATQMRAYLEVALTGFEEHFGVACKIGSIRYENNHAKIALEASVITEDGKVITKEAEDFKRYASNYDLKPEWLGGQFDSNGQTFTITGLKTRAKKYPVLATNDKGEGYKFPASRIKMLME